MTTTKKVQLGLTPEMTNYFEAIHLHMQVHNQPHLLTSQSARSLNSEFPSLPIEDPNQAETRKASEMMEQLNCLIEQTFLGLGEYHDSKKIGLSQEVQNSFNQLWSENLNVLIKAIEFMLAFSKDVHRYWPYLSGQMDRLVMACARVIGLMFTRYKSSLFVNAHNATRAPIINLLNSTAQLFHSIIQKSPLLPSKISSETYSTLFESLIPYYLFSEEESQNLDPEVQSKIESFITNMFSVSELNNLLLALLRSINAKMVEYNQDPSFHRKKMNILIKWIEQLHSYLSDSKVSKLNLDLILNEADVLIRAYPSSVFEISRDFRLLQAIREIVFKIVEYRGDAEIWDHLMMVLDKGDSGLIKYINIALEWNKLFKVKPFVPLAENADESDFDKLLCDYKPIIPDGLKLLEQESLESLVPELALFKYWLNNLASTSEIFQAQLCLDYLNQNFDDLVSKFSTALEPMMDVLILCCTRQYHLFTTLYYPPNVCQVSFQSLQIFHATSSLFKRIFTSTISLKSITSQTMSHMILFIFSLRLPWSSQFAEDGFTQLESSILTNDSLDKSQLICICIRLQTNIYKLPPSTFSDIQRFARQMLTELTIPLQFVTASMLSEQYDLNLILYEINEYVVNGSVRFGSKKVNSCEPIHYCTPLCSIEQLIYYILREREVFIYYNLKSILPNVCSQLERFIHETIGSLLKQNCDPQNGSVETKSQSQSIKDRFALVQVQRNVTDKLDEIQMRILPVFRKPEKYRNNLSWFGAKLREMVVHYDHFVQYPSLTATAIEALTEACSLAMTHFKNVKVSTDSSKSPQMSQYDLHYIYNKIGELLHKMYCKPDSLGHDYVTLISWKALIKENIAMLVKHANRPKEQLERHFQWIWDVQYALTLNTKPYYLLPFTLELFNAFLVELFNDRGYVSRDIQTSYLLVHVFTAMFDSSCGQMFLSPNALYTPDMPKEQFNVGAFLKQVDELFNCYPESCLEEDRDYKILVLIRRVLHRLYEHHGFLIGEFWSDLSPSEIAQSPVCAFFEQLIVQNGQIEQKKHELKNAVAIEESAKSPVWANVQKMQIQTD